MKSFILGVIVGVAFATVGIDGMSNMLNKGVNYWYNYFTVSSSNYVQETSQSWAKDVE